MIRTKEHNDCLALLLDEEKEHGYTKMQLETEQREHILLKQQYAEQQLVIEAYRDAYTSQG